MKKSYCSILLLFFISCMHAQIINWEQLETEDRHIVGLSTGIEYGTVFGLSYSRVLQTPQPILLTGTYSFPAGSSLLDDFKMSLGGKIRIVQFNQFQVDAGVEGLFRRYENELVRLQNFGAAFSTSFGYYKSKWFIAAEVNFDKAIVTHFKHSMLYAEQGFPAQDGWYLPTGGNFYFGLRSGLSFKQGDVFLRIGTLRTQYLDTSPLIPYAAQIGYSFRLK